MKRIIIIGYPKSGNTWVTRLTASLVNCPVNGFLYSKHSEIATEGMERVSNYRVFKSHHQYHELDKEDLQDAKLIYVIRDPRDISISGRHYFNAGPPLFVKSSHPRRGFNNRLMETSKKVLNKAYSVVKNFFTIRKEMNKAILHGNKNIHHWCRVSWKSHVYPYANNANILKVRYEDLLSNPIKESKRILHFIGIDKSDFEIQNDIKRQSFRFKKKQLLLKLKVRKALFLRKGQSEQWKKKFSKQENNMFTQLLKNELTALGYDIDR